MNFGMNKKFGRYLLMSPVGETGGAAVVADPAPAAAPATTQTNPEQHGVTGQQAPGTTIAQKAIPSALQEPEVAPVVEPVADPAPVADPVEPAAEPASTLLDPNAKPAADPAPVDGDFEEFEITIAEDSPLSEKVFKEIMDFVEEKGLNKEEAENLVKQQETMFTTGAEQVHAQMKAESESNRQALLNDPEIGGDKWAESVKIMSEPIKQFGDEDFNKLINSDIGNHPALGKFLYRLGKAMKTEAFTGKGLGANETVAVDPIKLRYPSFFTDEEKA